MLKFFFTRKKYESFWIDLTHQSPNKGHRITTHFTPKSFLPKSMRDRDLCPFISFDQTHINGWDCV